MTIMYATHAERLIAEKHVGCDILSIGHLHDDGDDIRPIAGNTITVDLGGQGRDVRVYEIVFYADGTGVVVCIAATRQSDVDAMPDDIQFDLVSGEVQNVRYTP